MLNTHPARALVTHAGKKLRTPFVVQLQERLIFQRAGFSGPTEVCVSSINSISPCTCRSGRATLAVGVSMHPVTPTELGTARL